MNVNPEDQYAALMQLAESFLPLIEFGLGQKVKLAELGWTPESAEIIARTMVVTMIQKAMQ